MKINKIEPIYIFLFCLPFFVGFILYSVYKQNKLIEDLKQNGRLYSGTIISYRSGGKDAINVRYSVVFDNKDSMIYFNPVEELMPKYKSFLIGKQFPVIINPQKKENAMILIAPANFHELGINFPDSLNWVLPYVINAPLK